MTQVQKTAHAGDALPGNWNESLLLAMVLTGHVLRTGFERFVGVPMSRLRLLTHMYAGGELSQADLQRHLDVDGATVTRQVKQMEAEGLLQRRVDPKDNRFTLVSLTPAGKEMVETLIKRGREFQLLATGNIDEKEYAAAVRVLGQIRCNLQELVSENHCGGPEEKDAQA